MALDRLDAPRRAAAVLFLAVLVACSPGSSTVAPDRASAGTTTTAIAAITTAGTGGAPAAGVDAGAFDLALRRMLRPPLLPAFAVPLEVFTDAQDRALAASLAIPPGLYDGIAVVDAVCGDGGAVAADSSGVVRQQDGSGSYRNDPVRVVVQGDGSGSYVDADTSITIQSDGSGRYRRAPLEVDVQGDGSGTYRDGVRTYRVSANGSGTYDDGVVRIDVDVNGTARYRDPTRTVTRQPGGAAVVDAEPAIGEVILRVLGEGLPRFAPVPQLGRVPAPRAGSSCGSVIRLDANVLFDFGEATVRPDAAALLDRVGSLLVAMGSPRMRVDGHTDGIGSEASNLVLSQRRAEAVVAALVARGVTRDSMTVEGFGEQHPLRPETASDGSDDPAARQTNRRVELVLLDP